MAKQKKSQYRLQLEKEVKPMLKEANMKLLNIEMLAKQEGFEGIKDFAYYNAMRDIRKVRGEEYKRFNIPKNTHQLEKVKRSLETFLGATTSTKKGIISVYEQNAATLNEKFGSNYSWQQMGQFLKAAKFEKLKSDYDSTRAIIMLKALYDNQNLSKKEFEKTISDHQIKGLDEVDSDTLTDFVKTELTWEELFPVEEQNK